MFSSNVYLLIPPFPTAFFDRRHKHNPIFYIKTFRIESYVRTEISSSQMKLAGSQSFINKEQRPRFADRLGSPDFQCWISNAAHFLDGPCERLKESLWVCWSVSIMSCLHFLLPTIHSFFRRSLLPSFLSSFLLLFFSSFPRFLPTFIHISFSPFLILPSCLSSFTLKS